MKKLTLTTLQFLLTVFAFFFSVTASMAQSDSVNIQIREKVINEIAKESEAKSKALEDKISSLDKKIKDIDSTLSKPSTELQTIEKLKERVKALEERQEAERSKELSVYASNYQTAVINLVSMEKEIKPLELFNASREFYSGLNDVANPMNYQGYNEWFAVFKKYMDDNKSKDAVLEVTSKVLATAGNLTKDLGITGTVSECLFASIGKFVEFLGGGKKNKELRDQSMKMFRLTMTLSQYTTDKNLIEDEWADINTQLEELKRLQDTTLTDALKYLGISRQDFKSKYTDETNAIKILDYLTWIRETAAKKVETERTSNGENWKDKIFLDMETVQSLKIRFGQTTTHVHGNIERYKGLIKKYKENEDIGEKVKGLETKLTRLADAFVATFNPQKYISDAIKMYRKD